MRSDNDTNPISDETSTVFRILHRLFSSWRGNVPTGWTIWASDSGGSWRSYGSRSYSSESVKDHTGEDLSVEILVWDRSFGNLLVRGSSIWKPPGDYWQFKLAGWQIVQIGISLRSSLIQILRRPANELGRIFEGNSELFHPERQLYWFLPIGLVNPNGHLIRGCSLQASIVYCDSQFETSRVRSFGQMDAIWNRRSCHRQLSRSRQHGGYCSVAFSSSVSFFERFDLCH